MATGIKVTPAQLASVSGQLNTGAGSIDGTLGQLARQVAPLGSDWAGVAQSRFIALWEQWQRAGAELREALTGIAGLMANASSNYQDTEDAIASTFQA